MPLIQNISLLIYYCLDQIVMFIWLPVTLYTLKVFRFDMCSYLLWIFQEPQDGFLVLILNLNNCLIIVQLVWKIQSLIAQQWDFNR